MSDEKFVGRAEARPPRQDPPTEPLPLAPPRRPRPIGLILGLIVGAFILLLVGIMAGFAIRTGGTRGAVPPAAPSSKQPPAKPPASPTPSPDGPRGVTEKFLNALRAGDHPTMQQQLCALLRDDNAAAASKEPSSGLSLFSLGTLASFKVGEEKINAVGASVKVELTLPLVGATNLEVYLVREGGGWRVCGAGPA